MHAQLGEEEATVARIKLARKCGDLVNAHGSFQYAICMPTEGSFVPASLSCALWSAGK